MRQLFKDYEVWRHRFLFRQMCNIYQTTPRALNPFSPLFMFACSQVQQHIVQVVFSITFSFSCTMFELIIFEILGALSSR